MTSDADKRKRSSDGGLGGDARPARDRQHLDSELGRFEPVSDALVLAAVERAERHREREREGVMMSDIAEHLGFVHGSWTTRRLRPQLEALIAEGLLAQSRRHGAVVWDLTEAGRGRLEQIRLAGEAGKLAEAPQHRAWRHARATAGERIDGFRADAREAVEYAAMLLDAEDVPSDAWFGIAERLQAACWRETCSERHGRARVQRRANRRDGMEQGQHKRGAGDRGQRPGTPAAKPSGTCTRGLEIGPGSDLLGLPKDHDGER